MNGATKARINKAISVPKSHSIGSRGSGNESQSCVTINRSAAIVVICWRTSRLGAASRGDSQIGVPRRSGAAHRERVHVAHAHVVVDVVPRTDVHVEHGWTNGAIQAGRDALIQRWIVECISRQCEGVQARACHGGVLIQLYPICHTSTSNDVSAGWDVWP